MASLQEKVEVALALAERESQESFLGYLRHVVIDALPDPAPFHRLARPWQWGDARRLDRQLEEIAGLPVPGQFRGPRNIWLTRARGHDKTTSIARLLAWLLAFSRRRVSCVHGAADRDQAKLLTDALRRTVALNPWLASRVSISDYHAAGPNASLQIITSDAPSAFGSLTDVFSVDEITNWKKPDLWEPLWSGRHKRPHALFLVITNAGVLGSWQHKIVEQARTMPDWYVWDEPRRLATWMNEEQVQRERALLLPSTAKRVIDNRWIDPGEESGYLTRADILACETEAARRGLVRQDWGLAGVEYVLSIDYGPKRDRTALAVMHEDLDGRVIVDQLDVWQGSPEFPVQISRIREWIETQRQRFADCRIVCDPYQLEELVQHYERILPTERFEARGGKGNYEMAECLRALVANRGLLWPRGSGDLVLPGGRTETLVDELASLVLRPLPFGYRFDHKATEHDDRAVVLGMGAVVLLNRAKPSTWLAPPTVQAKPEFEPLPINRGNFRGLWGLR